MKNIALLFFVCISTYLHGQHLPISNTPAAKPQIKVNSSPVPTPQKPKFHIVRYGDYPYLVAKLYGISPNDLLHWNGLSEDSKLNYGDTLLIENPQKGILSAKSLSKGNYHVVSYGENLYAIARQYGISMDDLLRWNRFTVNTSINKGDTVIVKSPF